MKINLRNLVYLPLGTILISRCKEECIIQELDTYRRVPKYYSYIFRIEMVSRNKKCLVEKAWLIGGEWHQLVSDYDRRIVELPIKKANKSYDYTSLMRLENNAELMSPEEYFLELL
jgi:uncharacterized protein affecting Mg2+/Co2+ transport